MPRPLVIAHRGASGYECENSRAAFRRALTLGADGVELDVHATRDGAMVVHHDPEIPGYGPIAELSGPRVRQARIANGETLPLLSEILDLLVDLEVWVEVKSLPARHDAALLAVLARGPAPHRTAVHSFDHRIVGRLGKCEPSLRRGILLSSYLEDPVAALRAVGATALWQEWHQVDRVLLDRVHGMGGTVVAWTVDQAVEVGRLTRLGVDAICGNYPDRTRAAVAAASGGRDQG